MKKQFTFKNILSVTLSGIWLILLFILIQEGPRYAFKLWPYDSGYTLWKRVLILFLCIFVPRLVYIIYCTFDHRKKKIGNK